LNRLATAFLVFSFGIISLSNYALALSSWLIAHGFL
jgi:hypothetical protein